MAAKFQSLRLCFFPRLTLLQGFRSGPVNLDCLSCFSFSNSYSLNQRNSLLGQLGQMYSCTFLHLTPQFRFRRVVSSLTKYGHPANHAVCWGAPDPTKSWGTANHLCSVRTPRQAATGSTAWSVLCVSKRENWFNLFIFECCWKLSAFASIHSLIPECWVGTEADTKEKLITVKEMDPYGWTRCKTQMILPRKPLKNERLLEIFWESKSTCVQCNLSKAFPDSAATQGKWKKRVFLHCEGWLRWNRVLPIRVWVPRLGKSRLQPWRGRLCGMWWVLTSTVSSPVDIFQTLGANQCTKATAQKHKRNSLRNSRLCSGGTSWMVWQFLVSLLQTWTLPAIKTKMLRSLFTTFYLCSVRRWHFTKVTSDYLSNLYQGFP